MAGRWRGDSRPLLVPEEVARKGKEAALLVSLSLFFLAFFGGQFPWFHRGPAAHFTTADLHPPTARGAVGCLHWGGVEEMKQDQISKGGRPPLGLLE